MAEWDRARVVRSGLCGFLAHGPLSHFYYLALDNWFATLAVREAAHAGGMQPGLGSHWARHAAGTAQLLRAPAGCASALGAVCRQDP